MKKKILKPTNAKPLMTKHLREKLIAVIHKVLKDNKTELTDKIEKVVEKSIKKIVKKTDKQLNKALKVK